MTCHTVLVIAALVAAPLGVPAQQPEPAHTIESVRWLQGCWMFTRGERTVEEHWTAPRGDNMVGTSRTVTRDALTAYELIVLRTRDGRLVYHAHPSGQPSAEFLSSSIGESEVIFENLTHDFPQRIGYRRVGADKVLAWIEGARDGKTRRAEFPFQRARCPGPAGAVVPDELEPR